MPKPPRICATCGSEYERDALFCPKDGTPLGNSRSQPADDPYLGTVIGDQIELRQLIGIGSMGRVYRAFQRGVERYVAVKMLHRELSANTTLVARFLREARVSSRLIHPNVVQVLMSGQLPSKASDSMTGNELYIVMEYLDGISLLSALAASEGAMPLPRALHVVLQICDAVGEAHAQGIVHRDLKPENVMLVRRGDDPDFVKVLDFGIARFEWSEESSVATQAGLIFGTARYISPEGAQGLPVGPAADVYAITTILYQCLAGRTPFDAESPVTLLVQHAHEVPPLVTSIMRASYVPPSIAAVIMRNLSKRPEERCADARSFGRELVEAAKAGGMSPDELVLRSTLLGQRSRSAAAFTSIERTKQHNLSAETAAKIGAYGHNPEAVADRESRTVVSHPLDSVTTTPPPVSQRLSGFDQLIRVSTSERMSNPLMVSAPAGPSTIRPSVEPTLDDDDRAARLAHRAQRLRVALVIIACFVAGAGGATYGAHRLGYLGPNMASQSSDFVARANDAIHTHRWDSPPGDNVKDITDEGLRRYPNDPQLIDARVRACEELITVALGKKYAGDLAGASSLARLASQLDPNSTTARHLVAELDALLVDGSAPTITPTTVDASVDRVPPAKGVKAPPQTSKSSSPLPLPTPCSTPSSVVVPPGTTAPGRWL